MTNTVASLSIRPAAVQIDKREIQALRAYRTKKPFAVVHFDPAGKGRIVSLPEGAKLHLIGPSCLRECFEVAHESQHYNIFKVDLLGPWSMPIENSRITSNAARVVAACA
ncbi:MAG: hypothetical protein ABSG13_09620 [Bryobacteraceae bacterium]|jgi:hypothetical protein